MSSLTNMIKKEVKELLTPATLAPIIIMAVVFAIPFSRPMIAMRELMFGNSGIVFAGIIYEAIFASVTMFIAVSMFKRDIVLTGMPKKPGKKRGWSSLVHYPGKK
jgi:ABC-2 type transport system permease protein